MKTIFKPDKARLLNALEESWSAETSSVSEEWSPAHPARGQCVPSTLVIQDILGGELMRYKVTYHGKDEMHYTNKLEDGSVLDSTKQQYPRHAPFKIVPVDLKGFRSIREKRLHDPATLRRYTLLRDSVQALLDK